MVEMLGYFQVQCERLSNAWICYKQVVRFKNFLRFSCFVTSLIHMSTSPWPPLKKKKNRGVFSYYNLIIQLVVTAHLSSNGKYASLSYRFGNDQIIDL